MIRIAWSIILAFFVLGAAGLAISAATGSADNTVAVNPALADIAAMDMLPGAATLAILAGGSLPLLLLKRRRRIAE